jgi:hypothetical protein
MIACAVTYSTSSVSLQVEVRLPKAFTFNLGSQDDFDDSSPQLAVESIYQKIWKVGQISNLVVMLSVF